MSRSEAHGAVTELRPGQIWRTRAGDLFKIPEGVNPLNFDVVEMLQDEHSFTIWRGGACPVSPASRVEVRLRSGDSIERWARKLSWEHFGKQHDIVAYKVVDETKDSLTGSPDGADAMAYGIYQSDIAAIDKSFAQFAGVDLGVEKDAREYTGGKVNYYEVPIKHPTREGRDLYTAECNDIIEALDMSFAEGEAFKAIWRGAAARKSLAKRGYTDGLYDAEKVAFYGGRMVVQEKSRREKSSSKD